MCVPGQASSALVNDVRHMMMSSIEDASQICIDLLPFQFIFYSFQFYTFLRVLDGLGQCQRIHL